MGFEFFEVDDLVSEVIKFNLEILDFGFEISLIIEEVIIFFDFQVELFSNQSEFFVKRILMAIDILDLSEELVF